MARDDIHSVRVIGSGPIVIGQAAELDYAGTQARHPCPLSPLTRGPLAMAWPVVVDASR
jgi:hypothetical protein